MCKVLAITNMKNVILDQKLVNTVKQELTKLDRDGFGYAVLTDDNNLGGERTTKPTSFIPMSKLKSTIVSGLPIVARTRDKFGSFNPERAKAFIAHGRLSTNSVSIQNTHPFASERLAMIHNGVVDDISEKDLDLKTNCDTEILFKHFEQGGMSQVEKFVTGYYAFAALDKVTGKLHIARDSRATLYLSYSRTIDSYIIATTVEIIRNVCKRMKWKYEQPELILDDTYVVFDGNHIEKHSQFTPKASISTYITSKANKAFHGTKAGDIYEGYPESVPYSDVTAYENAMSENEDLTDQSDDYITYDMVEELKRRRGA